MLASSSKSDLKKYLKEVLIESSDESNKETDSQKTNDIMQDAQVLMHKLISRSYRPYHHTIQIIDNYYSSTVD